MKAVIETSLWSMIVKIGKRLFLLWVIYLVVGLVVPPLFHKTGGRAEGVSENRNTAPERVMAIDNNMDALLWRLRLIEAARERLVLTTFDFRDDNSGQDMMAALFHAADRGVQVQILVDGFNGTLWLPGSRHFRELAAHENVQVKLYNPVNLLTPWKLNYRMHDKYLIADDFAYILGGRNTDDLFLGNYADSYNEDRDILVYETALGEGASYLQLREYFERIWDMPCCKSYKGGAFEAGYLKERYQKTVEAYPQAFTEVDWEKSTMEADRIELCTNPVHTGNKEPALWNRMIEEMGEDTELLVQTPYIICSRRMYQDLTDVCLGGAQVEIITNAVESGANPFGCTDYLNQKRKIQKTGVHVYEYLGSQALHTKTLLAGSDISMVGSCNLDMRSVYLDTELMLLIESPELNALLRAQAEELKGRSRHVAPDGNITDGENYEPMEQSWGKRIFYGILRNIVIPIRHLL